MAKDRHTTPGERLLAMIRPGNRNDRPKDETGSTTGAGKAPEAATGERPLFPAAEERPLFPAAVPDTVPGATAEAAPASAPEPAEERALFATMEPLDGTEAASVAPAAVPPLFEPDTGSSEPAQPAQPAEAAEAVGQGLFAAADLAGTMPAAVKPAAKAASKPRSRRRWSFGGKVHVGVDISKNQLVCVKTRGQDAGCDILGTAVVPLPEEAEPGSPVFVDILRRALSDLCGGGPVPSIWAASQTARVNVQFVSIPKVGSRQVDNAVFWTAKKEMGFDEGTSIFDFERRGDVEEKGMPRLGALAYTAERGSVRLIREAFVQAGYPLTGLTMEPFSHQTLFRRHMFPQNGGATAVLHVGQNWSRLEIGAGGNLIFVRVIKTSMAGMEQAVLDALESRGSKRPPEDRPSPAPAVTPPAKPEPAGESVVDLEGLGLGDTNLVLELDAPLEPVAAPAPEPTPSARRKVDAGQAREVLRCLVYGCDNLDETHPAWGVEEADIIDMLDPAASRLVRQVEMTLKHFRESLGFEGVTRLAVSGLLGASKHFVAYIAEQLGLPCIALDPVGDYLATGREVPGIGAPGVLYTQALGLALSDNAITPNLLFTYRDKAASRAARALEQWSLVGLAVVLAGLAFFTMDARWTTGRLDTEYQSLSRQLRALGGKADLDGLTRRVVEVQHRRDVLRTAQDRVRTLGVWGEALALAPDGVGLGTLRADYGPPGARAKKGGGAPGKNKAEPTGRLVLEGMISGDGRLFDSKLASYVVALEHSALFSSVTVRKSELEALEGGASGLHFVIALSLVEN